MDAWASLGRGNRLEFMDGLGGGGHRSRSVQVVGTAGGDHWNWGISGQSRTPVQWKLPAIYKGDLSEEDS